MGSTEDGGRLWSAGALWPVALITLLGAILRVTQIDQSLVGDEMWSYVGATRPDLGGMLDFVRSDEEITPPLYSTLAWLSAQLGDPTVLIRLPPIIGGIATIPLVWGIALRAFGRRAAIVAAALAALSPFLAYYSVEARAYGLAFACATASTLLLLIALERRSAGWWVGYGLASCAAMYSHYTVAYVLAAQLAWALWFHRDLWRPALLANALAVVLYLPWVPGLLEDIRSPTTDAISVLAPFTFDRTVSKLGSVPLGNPASGLETFWGLGLELLLFAGILIAIAGLVVRLRGGVPAGPGDGLESPRRDHVVLVVLLAAATPVAIIALALIGTDQLLSRNLGASVPYFIVAFSGLLCAGPRPLRIAATGIVVAVFAIGAVRSIEGEWRRADVVGAARLLDRELGPDDVVFDVVAPIVAPDQPPRLTLDVQLDNPHRVLEPTTPEEIDEAVASARGGRVAIAGEPVFVEAFEKLPVVADLEPVVDETLDGLRPVRVLVYEIPPAGT